MLWFIRLGFKGTGNFLSGKLTQWRERKVNHKSILTVIAGLFSLGLLSSILSSDFYVVFYPELFYVAVFALLVVVCIVFFKRDDRMVAKNKRPSYVNVIDQDMFIGKKSVHRSRKNLFLRVSIITLLSVFKRK